VRLINEPFHNFGQDSLGKILSADGEGAEKPLLDGGIELGLLEPRLTRKSPFLAMAEVGMMKMGRPKMEL
jgi:hypothetical protein